MDFFKSVFSDNPEEEQSDSETTSTTTSAKSQSPPYPTPTPNVSPIGNAWTFGSTLFKTLASKSESFIDTYRQDLEEFSSGLKKETAVIRQAATRAVKDLPTSLEAGAAAAQESLESVGQAIDNLAEIIARGKESLLANDSDSESSDSKQISGSQYDLNFSSKPYSRLDAQIRGIQCDLNTYCKEVEELDEFKEWKLGFVLDERGEEIVDLIEENGVIEEIYNEIVPAKVDNATFWERYFFRVCKVKKAEEARAKLVKRAISGEEEEELSWDDDDYEDRCLKQEDGEENNTEKYEVHTEEEGLERGNVDEGGVSEPRSDVGVDHIGTLGESESSVGKLLVKSDEKVASEGKTDSDISVISSQLSHEEEDLGWDEIEDIGSSDEHKVAADGSPNRADLRKRLSAADEEEDLTWDIEDDNEPVKVMMVNTSQVMLGGASQVNKCVD